MKILFLDIDGTVCTPRSHAAHGKGSMMLEWDKTGSALIKKICEKTGAKLVISSTWRHDVHHKHLFPALKKHKLWDLLYSDPLTTESWRTPNRYKGRGDEIMEWLGENTKVGEKFAIVDDCDEFQQFPGLSQNFVQTNFEDGLTYRNYYDLIKLLSD